MNILPSSTAGIIIMLVMPTISHSVRVKVVSENSAASGGIK